MAAHDNDEVLRGAFHLDVITVAVEQNRIEARLRHGHVGRAFGRVVDAEPARRSGRQNFDLSRFPVHFEVELHRSSSSRPATTQRLAPFWEGGPAGACGAIDSRAAASAATVDNSGGGSVCRGRLKNSSMKPVWRRPARNASSSKICRKKPRFVRMPPTSYSFRARIMRAMELSRVPAQTTSLASRWSDSIGTVQPS